MREATREQKRHGHHPPAKGSGQTIGSPPFTIRFRPRPHDVSQPEHPPLLETTACSLCDNIARGKADKSLIVRNTTSTAAPTSQLWCPVIQQSLHWQLCSGSDWIRLVRSVRAAIKSCVMVPSGAEAVGAVRVCARDNKEKTREHRAAHRTRHRAPWRENGEKEREKARGPGLDGGIKGHSREAVGKTG